MARNEGEEERWIHGEIVVRYNERQIKAEPEDVLWFAYLDMWIWWSISKGVRQSC